MPCNIIISCVLLLHLFTFINHMPCSFYYLSMMSSKAKMFYCFVYRSTCGGPCRYIWVGSYIKKTRGDVQVKNCVFIHKFREMMGWCFFSLLTMEVGFFGDILESVHCQMIYSSDLPALGSLQHKEKLYDNRLIR